MLRTSSTRPLLKSLCAPSSARISSGIASRIPNSNAQLRTLSAKRPQPLIANTLRPVTSTSIRYATNKNGPPFDVIDKEEEKKLAETPIEPHPSEVSGGSSVRHVFEESQAPKNDDDMLAGMKSDIVSNFSNTYRPPLLILTLISRKLLKKHLRSTMYQGSHFFSVLLVCYHISEHPFLQHTSHSTLITRLKMEADICSVQKQPTSFCQFLNQFKSVMVQL